MRRVGPPGPQVSLWLRGITSPHGGIREMEEQLTNSDQLRKATLTFFQPRRRRMKAAI